MSSAPAPNPDLAELVGVLGADNVRMLVRTFLREFPTLLRDLENGDRATRHRITHSLKSNARVVGARELAAAMERFELRLGDPAQPDLTPDERTSIRVRFETLGRTLTEWAGPA